MPFVPGAGAGVGASSLHAGEAAAQGFGWRSTSSRFVQGEPPTWSPGEGATGTALIELQGGALVLWNLILRHEPTARLEHLIHVEDGHLVLSRCQLTAAGVSPTLRAT